MKTFILITIIVLLIFSIIFSLIYIKTGFGKKFYHNIMGWHQPDDKVGFDGCSLTATCKYCHKRILQDSQGNWFSIGSSSEDV